MSRKLMFLLRHISYIACVKGSEVHLESEGFRKSETELLENSNTNHYNVRRGDNFLLTF